LCRLADASDEDVTFVRLLALEEKKLMLFSSNNLLKGRLYLNNVFVLCVGYKINLISQEVYINAYLYPE
jgi:hypothetical protein